MPQTGDGATPPGRNRLAGSTSPYLLQHKDNPVYWYPWGPEALEEARKQDKPIFLSVGYSACHWCHVMAHESFEDPATAEVMNRYFINIKVDREERPDLDDIYMTAVQMITGSGGWPMSVWLTPDLKPFYGGTYFPNVSRHGRPSFVQVLSALGEAWKNDRPSLLAQADRIHEGIIQYMTGARTPPGGGALSRELVDGAIQDLTSRFDHVDGGFGSAPKFPPHRGLMLLLARYRATRDVNLLRMATLTFDRMARGGMYDQIGGGFHRYSTDAQWLVPHFEKMLYDNALLADAYIDAWQTTGDDFYRRVCEEIFAWVEREMTSPDGAFYSSLDADSEGEEGRFYVWKPEEVSEALGADEATLVDAYFGITQRGNFEGETSIPHVDTAPAEFAKGQGMSAEALARRIDAARVKLLAARAKRVRPHLDDKILTAWNGLMIEALARGASAFHEKRYAGAASRAAQYLLARQRGADGLMRVSSRGEKVSPDGFLDDQAFFARGLIALHEATGDRAWLEQARSLVEATESAFKDPAGKGYYFAPAGRTDVIVRAKNPTDGAIPSGNSVMAETLVDLARLTGQAAYRRRAGELLGAFSGAMAAMPGAFNNMIGALDRYLDEAGPSSPIVKVTAVRVEPDDSQEGTHLLSVEIEVAKGWHINASSPTLDYLIPTRLTFEPPQAVTTSRIDYPQGTMVELGFAGQPIAVYEGTISVRARLAPGETTARRAEGRLTYQACNDTACQPPASLTFEVPEAALRGR